MSQDSDTVFAISKRISAAVEKNKASDLKGFSIFMTQDESHVASLNKWVETIDYTNVGWAYVGKDDPSIGQYKVNTDASILNTVLIYKNRRVVAKFINLGRDEKSLDQLDKALDSVSVK